MVVVGAGLSGICAGIKLGEAGYSYRIYDRNKDVGGTWPTNVYPGVGVDTPSHFYSYSFEANPDWPEFYSKGACVLDYLRQCADGYGVREQHRLRDRGRVLRLRRRVPALGGDLPRPRRDRGGRMGGRGDHRHRCVPGRRPPGHPRARRLRRDRRTHRRVGPVPRPDRQAGGHTSAPEPAPCRSAPRSSTTSPASPCSSARRRGRCRAARTT
ncbi:NAD(P)-binding protein [Yinghuangia aomiensis]